MRKIIKSKKLLLAILSFCILSILEPLNAFAYNTYNNHVLTGGVGNYGNNNRYYFIDNTASLETTLINNAMNDWIFTTSSQGITTPISFKKTTTQTSSIMDIYYDTYYDSSLGIIAETKFFIKSSLANPSNSNWGWAAIELNIPTYRGLSTFDKKGTIAHEMGHAFGLAHNNGNPNVIMCQLKYNRAVNSAQKDDLNGINYLY